MNTYAQRFKTTEERFLEKVDRRGPDECWPWTSNLTEDGYGTFWIAGGSVRSHRFAYEAAKGPIPEGLEVDHTCHNGSGCECASACPHRRCCNPAHLEAVSGRVNALRSEGIMAKHARQTHCKRGHPFDANNTRVGTRGKRVCIICDRDAKRAWLANNRERSRAYRKEWERRRKLAGTSNAERKPQ